MNRYRFQGWQNVNLLFNANIVKFLLKINGRETRKPKFVFFLVWSVLIDGRWVVVA